MRTGEIGALLKRNPEQPPGHIETGVHDAIERQVGLEFTVGEIELPRLQLLGVIAPVPSRHRVIGAFLGNKLGERLALLVCLCGGALPDIAQKVAHSVRCLGHRVVELVSGIGSVPEEFRLLVAQLHHFGDDRPVVGIAAIVAPRDPGIECLFAQITARAQGQKRFDYRTRQGYRETPLVTAVSGNGRHRVAQVVGQAFELFALVDQHHPVALVSQHVLAELCPETRKPLADFGKASLSRVVELGARLDEGFPDLLEQPVRFRGQPEVGAPRMEVVDPCEKRLVHRDLRVMPRHLRRDLTLERLDRVVGIGTGTVPEDRRNARELLTRQFHRHDRVVERRCILAQGDCLDLRFVRGKGGIEGRREILVGDCLEIRQTERAGPGEERFVKVRGHG